MNNNAFIADIIDSLPEMSGAFLFDAEQGVLAQRMENSTATYQPASIGTQVVSIAQDTSHLLNDLTSIQVSFDTLLLSCRLLPDGLWLCLLHAPDLSPGMINMAVQMALKNSESADEDSEGAYFSSEDEYVEENETDEQFAEDAPDDPVFIDTDAMVAPGAPMARQLNRLLDELANFIGPAATPVFHDLLATWSREQTPSVENLPHLVTLIEQEIDDPEELKAFRSNLPSLLA